MSATYQVTIPPATGQSTLLAVISRAASDPACDIEKMERLLAMHERMQERQAEQAFNEAMNAVQAETRRVAADANNAQTRSKYATYAALDRALRPIYSAHGFSISFDTGTDAPEGNVRVLAYVSHSGGHTRTYRALIPSDGKGAKGGDVMTKTHAFGAASSYGMRYLLKMIFNVAIGEDDDDGNIGQHAKEATPPAQPPRQERQATPAAKQPYPQESFDKNFAAWKALVESGTKSTKDIISTIESKATLTKEQREEIELISAPTAAENPADDADWEQASFGGDDSQ